MFTRPRRALPQSRRPSEHGGVLPRSKGRSQASVPESPPSVSELAERVIRAADREHPADDMLRAELRAQRQLIPGGRRAGEQAGVLLLPLAGLARSKPVRCESKSTMLGTWPNVMQPEPQSFTDAELLARAVPDWVATVMKPSAAWVRALQAEPRLWLRAHRGQGRAVAEKLGDCRVLGAGSLGRYSGIRWPQ